VHAELHRLARHYMAGERAGHTLQTSALVNEAYLRLIDITRVHWQNRAHFFAMGARTMRRILVDSARARGNFGQKIAFPRTAAERRRPAIRAARSRSAIQHMTPT
jgi:ECF sigma factor